MINRTLSLACALVTASTLVVGCSGQADEEREASEADGTADQELLAGRRLSPGEVARLVREAGFPESSVGKMVCTAKYESSYYERASNQNRNGSIDRGLFQINSIHLGHTKNCPSGSEAIYDATTNAKCAYSIFKLQGHNAWYGYQAHRSECNNFAAPASTGGGDDNNDDNGDNSDDSAGLGCYSPTLHARVDNSACVQARSNSVWYQCKDNVWSRGVQGDSGPHGACTSKHALDD